MLPKLPFKETIFSYMTYNNIIVQGERVKETCINDSLNNNDLWVIYVGVKCNKCKMQFNNNDVVWIDDRIILCNDCKIEGFVPIPLMINKKYPGYVVISKQMYKAYNKIFSNGE